jgi:glutamyl-tRNA synthetase
MIITRFAPSPTGYLHVGNIRTALINWLFARSQNGKFILRIDDTDRERSKQEYVDGILRDMEWLGLHWDEIHYQSKRIDLHEAAKNRMIESGRLYPCFESAEELEVKKKVALSRNLPPIYDRSALKLTSEERKEVSSKINPHYRFLMDESSIDWVDGVKGAIHFDPKNISDPVLVRADGTMTYMIASVADDIDLKITDIIRGEDHITNSAIHTQMFAALGAKAPSFSHLALIKSKDGEISKRLGGFDVASLREAGIHPLAISSFLAKIGTSSPVEFRRNLDELVHEFSLSIFSKAPTTYNITELERLNTKLTHSLSHAEAKPYMSDLISEEFWNRVRPNLEQIRDAEVWWKICSDAFVPKIVDPEFTIKAASLLPKESNWNENTWNIWVEKIKSATGRAGKELFMPIRLALTGEEHGPELKNLLPILGRDKVITRLGG